MNDDSFFCKMVDELVEFGQFDPELKEGLQWVDRLAQKKGISFYDMVYEILHRHDTNTSAKEWLKHKND